MSTAAVPGAIAQPSTVKAIPIIPSTLAGNAAERKTDLTIHRITKTHHGRTLLLLGHAAEHLANGQRFSADQAPHPGDQAGLAEAIHILLGLSRAVFDEFAGHNTRRWRVEQWAIARLTGLIERKDAQTEGKSAKTVGKGALTSGYPRREAGCIPARLLLWHSDWR